MKFVANILFTVGHWTAFAKRENVNVEPPLYHTRELEGSLMKIWVCYPFAIFIFLLISFEIGMVVVVLLPKADEGLLRMVDVVLLPKTDEGLLTSFLFFFFFSSLSLLPFSFSLLDLFYRVTVYNVWELPLIFYRKKKLLK